MTATGGSIESVSLEGREFAVAADAEAQRKLGGWENEIQANGNGTVRNIKTRVPMSITGLTIEIDDSRGDAEFIQDLADRTDLFAVSITYASGVTYQGTAQLTGEIQTSSQNQTCAINLAGPARLTLQ